MSIPCATYLIQRSYTDFDQLAEEAKQWQLDLRQLDRGSFHGEMLQFGIGDVHITEARFGRSLLQNGMPPSGLRTIGVPADSNIQFEWRGKHITGDDILVFPRGAELASVSGSDFHIYTCSFSEELLIKASSMIDVGTMDELCGTAEVFRSTSGELSSVRRSLRYIFKVLRSNEELLSEPNFVARVTLDLPCQLLSAISGSIGSYLPKTNRKRELALSRADAYIKRFAREDLRIGDICQAADVSQRTLEYAFVERYGLTPKAFLRAFRLNAVRRDLRTASSTGQRIVDTANRWGFWHMGQFAADYRKHFGELPSQTIQD